MQSFRCELTQQQHLCLFSYQLSKRNRIPVVHDLHVNICLTAYDILVIIQTSVYMIYL